MKIRQFLATRIFVNKYIFVDYWSILHVALFFLFGVYYPNQWGLVIFGSIIFELVENRISKKAIFLKEPIRDTISDFLFNFLGYYLGMLYIAGALI